MLVLVLVWELALEVALKMVPTAFDDMIAELSYDEFVRYVPEHPLYV